MSPVTYEESIKILVENIIRQYDDYCASVECQFSICKKNPLYSIYMADNQFAHPILNSAANYRYNYFLCRENLEIKPDNAKRGAHHICACFPVMIGSKLDRWIRSKPVNLNILSSALNDMSEIVYNRPTFDDDEIFTPNALHDVEIGKKVYECEKLLYYATGYYLIRGKTYFIPFVLVNNRELPHNFRDRYNNSYRFFYYDKERRGHKFELMRNIDINLDKNDTLENLTMALWRYKSIPNLDFMFRLKKEFGLASDTDARTLVSIIDKINSVSETLSVDVPNDELQEYQEKSVRLRAFISNHIDTIQSKFIYRDYNGENHVNIDNFIQEFENNCNFDPRHVSITQDNIIAVLHDVEYTNVDIDDFRNKLILPSPELFNRLFSIYDGKSKKLCKSYISKIINLGNFESVISQKIKFDTQKSDIKKIKKISNQTENTTNFGNTYTSSGAHESSYIRLVRMNHMFLFPALASIVDKPRGKNVKNVKAKNIPANHTGYLCKYMLGNIATMGNKSAIVYDVMATMSRLGPEIDILVNKLFELKFIERGDGKMKKNSIIINGLPSAYMFVDAISWMHFFFACKTICKYALVKRTQMYVYISFVNGTPIKPLEIDGKKYYISPTEMYLYFNEYMNKKNYPLVCTTALLHQNRFISYGTYSKQVVATQCYQNTMNPITTAPLQSSLVSYGPSCYIGTKILNAANEKITLSSYGTFKLRTLFADYRMMLCEDAYYFNEKLNFDITCINRYNIEITINNTPLKVIEYDSKKCMRWSYYTSGDRKDLTIYVAKIISATKIPNYMYAKLSRLEMHDAKNNVYVYTIYKTVDHAALMNCELEDIVVKNEFHIINEFQMKKLNIVLNMVYKKPYINGTKFCTFDGLKGIGIAANLSHIRDEYGNEPDILTSIHGCHGREPLPQLKNMAMHQCPDFNFYNQNGEIVESGGFNGYVEYFMLCNYPFDTKSENQIRLDHYSTWIMYLNGIPLTHYNRRQYGFSEAEKYRILPDSSARNLELLNIQKTKLKFPITKTYNNKRLYSELVENQKQFNLHNIKTCKHE